MNTQDRIRQYLRYDSSVDVTVYADLVLKIASLSAAERMEALGVLDSFYCIGCARDLKPNEICHCQNDE